VSYAHPGCFPVIPQAVQEHVRSQRSGKTHLCACSYTITPVSAGDAHAQLSVPPSCCTVSPHQITFTTSPLFLQTSRPPSGTGALGYLQSNISFPVALTPSEHTLFVHTIPRILSTRTAPILTGTFCAIARSLVSSVADTNHHFCTMQWPPLVV